MTGTSVLLVDVDGVLRRWQPTIIGDAEAQHGLPPGSLHRSAFAEPALTRAVTGVLSDQQWRDDIAARLARATTCPPGRARAAVDQWSASPGAVDLDVLGLLREQRGRRTVALLSNATDRLEADLDRLHVLQEVDAVYNSSWLALAKPDPAVFAAVTTDLGVDASRCAFVDDTLRHVHAAAALGMRAHHFTRARDLATFLASLH